MKETMLKKASEIKELPELANVDEYLEKAKNGKLSFFENNIVINIDAKESFYGVSENGSSGSASYKLYELLVFNAYDYQSELENDASADYKDFLNIELVKIEIHEDNE